MAQDVVVKESLSETLIEEGASLVAKLDEAGWRANAAFWFYFPDVNAWRLLLAAPAVATKGPRDAYAAIQQALAQTESGKEELALEDIGVMPPDHPLVRILGTIIGTGPGISRIRFSKNVINGHFIDDALIYRLS